MVGREVKEGEEPGRWERGQVVRDGEMGGRGWDREDVSRGGGL